MAKLTEFEKSDFNLGEFRNPPNALGIPDPGTDPIPSTADHVHGISPQWRTLTLTSPWVAYGSVHQAPQIAVVDQLVIVRGLITSNANGNVKVADLPEGARMKKSNSDLVFLTNSAIGGIRLDVTGPNGGGGVGTNAIIVYTTTTASGFVALNFMYFIN